MYYFRYVMLVIYFVELFPIYGLFYFLSSKYGLDILIFMDICLVYTCFHLHFYPKYKAYFDSVDG